MSDDATDEGRETKERRFPVAISWVVFLVTVIVGAGLISDPDPRMQVIGFVLLFAPLVVFSMVMALFYWRSRRHMQQQVAATHETDDEGASDDDVT